MTLLVQFFIYFFFQLEIMIDVTPLFVIINILYTINVIINETVKPILIYFL